MANPNLMNKKYIIDIVKYRWAWLTLSILLVLPCLVAIVYSMIIYPNHAPIKLGIDFSGGTILQYTVDAKDITSDDVEFIRQDLAKRGVEAPVIQTITNAGLEKKEKDAQNFSHIISIKTKFIDEKSDDASMITAAVKDKFKSAGLVQTTSVGPSLGKELLKNSAIAMLLALLGIVAYITLRFQLDLAIISLISLMHDIIFVIGAFSILSLMFNTQIDSLFITALLTVIGFSMHDTVVVFDRIRENNRFLAKKYSIGDIVDASVNQTLARSINTSLTTLIVLLSLYFFGGATTKEFVLAMILGIMIGTYSSIFFASLLVAWYRGAKDGSLKAKAA